jgi:hypothetical protein
MQSPKPTAKLYCNVLAMQKGIDPVGYASDFDRLLIVEIPLPWKRNIYEKAGALPQQIIDLMALWLKRYHEGIPYRQWMLMIAPDPQYSRPGYRRALYYSRPEGRFAQFDKIEYLVPESELGALAWSLFEGRDNLPHFEQYREAKHDKTRDLLVCTHGTVDVACAKFGYPLYNHLRKNYVEDGVRTWRVSHFGGHIFAPTLVDMATGHYWAYVEEQQAGQIVRQDGDVQALRGHYRGWAGLEDSFLQAAERELWMRHGWAWFSYSKSGRVLSKDTDEENPAWAEVQLDYTVPDGTQGSCTARVEVHKRIPTIGSTDYEHEYPYPQYVVTAFHHTAIADAIPATASAAG